MTLPVALTDTGICVLDTVTLIGHDVGNGATGTVIVALAGLYLAVPNVSLKSRI